MAKRSERGSSALEFMLSSLIWIPLLMGTAVFGYNLVKAIQVSQFCRDAGHMFAYGIDFTTTQNKTLLTTMAKPLNISNGSGSGAIVLSQVTYVTQADCTAANASPCQNLGTYVFTSFQYFGNPQYAKTKLSDKAIDSYIWGGKGITFNDYVTNTDLQAGKFSTYLQYPVDPVTNKIAGGQITYISEVSVATQFMNYGGYSGTGSYARNFF